MVTTKEEALNAVKKFLGTPEDKSTGDVRGPYSSFDGPYFTVEFKKKKYKVYKNDGQVKNA